MKRLLLALFCLPAALLFGEGDVIAYLASTDKEKGGIYIADFDSETGKLSEPRLAAKAERSGFVALSKDGGRLFACVGVTEEGQSYGGAASYSVDRKTGALTELSTVASKGSGACHVAVTPDGKMVAIANYGSGSVVSYTVGDDGKLTLGKLLQHEGSSVNESRQKGPHAHCVVVSPNGRHLYSADLGCDKIFVYRIGEGENAGKIWPNKVFPEVKTPAGGGTRHFTIHPSEQFAYTNNELTSSVTGFKYDKKTGALETIDSIPTLPKGWDGKNSTSEILCHPSGKFLYTANRGHNSIAAFKIEEDGKLGPLGQEPCGGDIPRNFGITPCGKWILVANQKSGNVAVLKVDLETGKLTKTDVSVDLPSAMCARFLVRE